MELVNLNFFYTKEMIYGIKQVVILIAPNASNMVDDSIRIKAAEICLDYEDTNLHGTYPNAATRNTRY